MKGLAEMYITTDRYFVTRPPNVEKVDCVEIQSRVNFDKKFFFALEAIDLFREHNNAAAGLMAFVNFFEAGIYPPEELLEWLSNTFSEWTEKEGKIDLERILKLSKQTRGNTKSIKKVRLIQRNIEITSELRLLTSNFDISLKRAAEMIARRMEEANDPLTIDADSIIRDIQEDFRIPHEKKYGFSTKVFNEDEKKDFLDNYPKDVHSLVEKT